jgi:transcriptional regulator with XRE-family HTH domain
MLLGKRVRELRAARKWSQEEFAHVSGLHRTYIGQIERGEKNISFENLSKISGVLGVTLSELLAGLDDVGVRDRKSKAGVGSDDQETADRTRQMFEVQKMVRRLRIQRAAMDRTVLALEDLAESGCRNSSVNRRKGRRVRPAKK